MRNRDIVIVVLSIVALVGLWSQDGSVSLTPSFYLRMHSVGHHRYLPRPVVTDVDGDGFNELIAVTQPEKIGVVKLIGASSRVAATLEPSKTFSTFANIIGFGTGYLTFPGNHSSLTASSTGLWFGGNTKKRHSMQGHQQHVCVITDDFKVTLLTAALVEVWAVSFADATMSNIIPRTATVSILPDRIFEHDTGMVVVAMTVSGIDEVPRLSIAAFDGATGDLRWRHFVENSAASLLSESNSNLSSAGLNFKLTEHDLSEHSNSLEWTQFRESVLSAAPFSFNHPWDSALQPFRFVHTKNRKKQSHNDDLKKVHSERPKEHHALRASDAQHQTGELGARYASALATSKHGSKGGARRQHLRPLPNALVFRTVTGVFFVHMFTGRTVTSLQPLKRDVTYDDLDDDLTIESVEVRIGVEQEQFGRHGFDERFNCRGVVMTNAASSETLMATAPICDSEGYVNSLGLLRHLVRGDAAEQAAPHLDPLNRIGSRNVGDRSSQAARPIVAHLRRPIGRHIYKTQRLAIFFVSHGIVTALEPKHGGVVWRTETPSSFEIRAKDDTHDAASTQWYAVTSQEDREAQLHHYPHLLPYNFHQLHDDPSDVRNVQAARHRHEPLIVAVGSSHLTLLDAIHGGIAATVGIDHVPVGPTIVGDIDGDGINDLIATTATGYHGFSVKKHASGTATAMILVIVVVVCALLFVSRHGSDFDAFGNNAGVFDEADDDLGDAPILGRSGVSDGLRRRTGKRSTD